MTALLFLFDVGVNCINLENRALAQTLNASDYCIDLCAEEFPNVFDFLAELVCQNRCNRCEELGVHVCIEASVIPGAAPSISCDCGGDCCSSNEKCCRMESGDFCCSVFEECCEGGRCGPILSKCCGEESCRFLEYCCEDLLCCNITQECCRGREFVNCCRAFEECCDGKCCGLGETCCTSADEDGELTIEECCPLERCTELDGCCKEGDTPCDMECCTPDESCKEHTSSYGFLSQVCCAQGEVPCVGVDDIARECCSPDKCINGICETDENCPTGELCGEVCCVPGECEGGECKKKLCNSKMGEYICGGEGPEETFCCEPSDCCELNENCYSNGSISRCCPPNEGICWGKGEYESLSWCCPEGWECCGTLRFQKGLCCAPPSYCCGNECCSN